MKVSAPHRGWTSGRATPSLRPNPYAAKTANPAGRHLSFAEICPDDRGRLLIRRKHTANAKRELPGLLMEIIEPLAQIREAQALTFERYKTAMLTDQQADHIVLNLYRQSVINLQRIPEVIEQWERPTFPDLDERNAWRMFNSVTYALSGRVLENAHATPKLHEIIDVCVRLFTDII